MSPDAAFVVAVVGRGACTETRILCAFIERGLKDAERDRVPNAITEAVQAGKIEMFRHGCYQLTAGAAQMEKA